MEHQRPDHAVKAIGTGVVALAIVVAAFRVGTHSRPALPGSAPHPTAAGALAFLASGLFFAAPASWLGVSIAVVVIVAASVVIGRLSRRDGWTDTHRLAVAGGALLTYAWGAFVVGSVRGRVDPLEIVFHVFFALGALVLLAAAAHRLRTSRSGKDGGGT